MRPRRSLGLDRRRPARHAGRMHAADRFRLLGAYKTPRFRYGRVVRCAVRGEVEVVLSLIHI